MSTGNPQVFGQQAPQTDDNEFNVMSFVFQMLLQKVQTATLVEVLSCTNDGGVSPVGRVSVQPLVNQMSGNRQATPHGPIYNLVYCRLAGAGGAQAVILDPTPGQIGLMCFCSRDISSVVNAMAAANPASFRMFDWADGVLAMTLPLGATPTEYIQFLQNDGAPGGIKVVSPVKITLSAPTVEIDATSQVTINSPTVAASGNITAADEVTAKAGSGSEVNLSTHTTSEVTSGTGTSGPPTPGT